MLLQGFTLIEILVVLVVIAIVLAVALMSFGDFGASRKQQLSLLQLKASIKSAQLEAILKPEVLGLVVTQTGYRYYAYQHNANNSEASWLPLEHDHLSDIHAFSSTVTISLIASTPKTKNEPRIYFLPDGSITPFKMMIIFNNDQTFKIFLNNSGEIRVEKA